MIKLIPYCLRVLAKFKWKLFFLVAKRLCPSARRSVRRSVRRSIRRSVRPSVHNAFFSIGQKWVETNEMRSVMTRRAEIIRVTTYFVYTNLLKRDPVFVAQWASHNLSYNLPVPLAACLNTLGISNGILGIHNVYSTTEATLSHPKLGTNSL